MLRVLLLLEHVQALQQQPQGLLHVLGVALNEAHSILRSWEEVSRLAQLDARQ